MKPRTNFLIGGALVLGVAGYLMASSIKQTGVYYLTPTELATKIQADPTFMNAGVSKCPCRVVTRPSRACDVGSCLNRSKTSGGVSLKVGRVWAELAPRQARPYPL